MKWSLSTLLNEGWTYIPRSINGSLSDITKTTENFSTNDNFIALNFAINNLIAAYVFTIQQSLFIINIVSTLYQIKKKTPET